MKTLTITLTNAAHTALILNLAKRYAQLETRLALRDVAGGNPFFTAYSRKIDGGLLRMNARERGHLASILQELTGRPVPVSSEEACSTTGKHFGRTQVYAAGNKRKAEQARLVAEITADAKGGN